MPVLQDSLERSKATSARLTSKQSLQGNLTAGLNHFCSRFRVAGINEFVLYPFSASLYSPAIRGVALGSFGRRFPSSR